MKAKRQDEPVYNKKEREEILASMEKVRTAFYYQAVQTKCHPFIEFCGVMGEYLTVCREAHKKGIDFTQANTHSGQALPIQTHNAAYLAEKLNCIYGPSLIQNEEVREAFISRLFDGQFKLVPVVEKSELAEKAERLRDPNYASMSGEEQWADDKANGLLDWDGR
jgi:hypothetical protein